MFTEAQFNRNTLECMTALRRRLKQELGIRVRLSDVDAVRQMIHLSQNSRQGDIRELGLRLAGMTTPEAELEVGIHLARGAIAARQRLLPQASDPGFEAPRPTDSAPLRIYRGQVVR